MLDELSNLHWGNSEHETGEEPDVIPKPKRAYKKRDPKPKPTLSFLPELVDPTPEPPPPPPPADEAAPDGAAAEAPPVMPVFKKRAPPNAEVMSMISELDRINPSGPAPKRARGSAARDDSGGGSEDPTEIKGVAKLHAEQKIQQLKLLFPEELKGFRVRSGDQPLEYLEKASQEMETIVSLGQVDSFMMDSVYQVLTLIEGATARSAADVSGLVDLLKQNREFEKLCKICFVKYRVFGKVPPETQLLFIVATTAYICRQKNVGKAQIRAAIDVPLTPEQAARVAALTGDAPRPASAAAAPSSADPLKPNPLAGFN